MKNLFKEILETETEKENYKDDILNICSYVIGHSHDVMFTSYTAIDSWLVNDVNGKTKIYEHDGISIRYIPEYSKNDYIIYRIIEINIDYQSYYFAVEGKEYSFSNYWNDKISRVYPKQEIKIIFTTEKPCINRHCV